ncbi:MAG: glutathione S-transferase family protein [Polyangiales bacterium]
MSRPKLITIPISHYCEKARWALERAGVAYDEEGHAPLLHWKATLPLHARTVPILVTTGSVLTESTDIVRWADARTTNAHLYPDDPQLRREVDELVELFDRKLGPATRRFAYFHVLPNRKRALELVTTGVPDSERKVMSSLWMPITTMMRRGMNVNAHGAERSLARIRAIFAEVEGRLSDRRKYLVGDAFSAADLAFAALASPVIGPSQNAFSPPLELYPEVMRREATALRDTVAGKFALRMWREERPRGQSASL